MGIALRIALAKRTSWFAAVADNDELIADGPINSTKKNLVDLVNRFAPEVVLVEASSITAWAVDTLINAGAPVFPVHLGSRPSRRSRRKKTDKVDARLLVRLYRAGVLTRAWTPPIEIRNLRNTARARHTASPPIAQNSATASIARTTKKAAGSSSTKYRKWPLAIKICLTRHSVLGCESAGSWPSSPKHGGKIVSTFGRAVDVVPAR